MEKPNRRNFISKAISYGTASAAGGVLAVSLAQAQTPPSETVFVLDTINDLRNASSQVVDTGAVLIKGHTSANDGGQGHFHYISGAVPGSYADDDGVTIVPFGGDGSSAWRRLSNYVTPEMFGAADASALNKAINAAAENYSLVVIENEVEVDDVVKFRRATRLIGRTLNGSALNVVSGGKLKFCHHTGIQNSDESLLCPQAANDRYTSIENLVIRTADSSVDLIHINSGYEIKFINCLIKGGGKSVRIDNGVHITFDSCKLINASGYALHCNAILLHAASSFVNHLKLLNTRVDGRVFVDAGEGGRNFVIDNCICESGIQPAVRVEKVKSLKISGSYFENYNSAQNCLILSENVLAGIVEGCSFDTNNSAYVHIVCYGKAISYAGNYFSSIGNQSQIVLAQSSKYCRVGPQLDGGGGDQLPKVTDMGASNQLFEV